MTYANEDEVTVDGQRSSEKAVGVQEELLEHAAAQTELLGHIAKRLNFFYFLACIGLALLVLYVVVGLLWLVTQSG